MRLGQPGGTAIEAETLSPRRHGEADAVDQVQDLAHLPCSLPGGHHDASESTRSPTILRWSQVRMLAERASQVFWDSSVPGRPARRSPKNKARNTSTRERAVLQDDSIRPSSWHHVTKRRPKKRVGFPMKPRAAGRRAKTGCETNGLVPRPPGQVTGTCPIHNLSVRKPLRDRSRAKNENSSRQGWGQSVLASTMGG